MIKFIKESALLFILLSFMSLTDAATISGEIIDSDGQGIENVTILALNQNDIKAIPYFPDNPKVHNTKSDNAGNFSFVDLPIGTYILHSDKNGYRSEYYEKTQVLSKASPIVITNNKPAKSIKVLLYTSEYRGGEHPSLWVVSSTTSTDDNGKFVFKNFPKRQSYKLAYENTDGEIRFYENSLTVENATFIAIESLSDDINIKLATTGTAFDNSDTSSSNNEKTGSGSITLVTLFFMLFIIILKYYTVKYGIIKNNMVNLIKIGRFLLLLILTSASHAKSISGNITDSHGVPLNNIRIEAFNYNESNGWRNDEIASTNASGYFLIEDLRHNKYRLKFTDRINSNRYEFYDNTSRFTNAQDISINNNQNIQLQNIILGDLGTGVIRGTVRNTTGHSVRGVSVSLSYINTGEYRSYLSTTTTDNQGRYSFTNIQSNSYELTANGATLSRLYTKSINLEAGDDITGLNFEIETNGSIKGTIQNINGEPLSNVNTIFYTRKGDKWVSHSGRQKSDNNGQYEFYNLPPDNYRILAKQENGHYEFYDNTSSVIDATTIVVLSDKETVANMTLGDLETASLGGILTDRTTGKPITSSKVIVSIKDYEFPDATPYWLPISTAITDDDGQYLFSNLPQNNYLVSAADIYRPEGVEPTDRTVVYLQNNESQYEVDIFAGTTKLNQNITLSFAHGNIEGTVIDTIGKGLENITVDAYRRNTHFPLSILPNPNKWTRVNTTKTDENGYYNFNTKDNITIGEYRLKFSNLDKNTYEYNDNAKAFDKAEIISVSSYQNKVVNLMYGKDATSPESSTNSGSGTMTLTILAFLLLLVMLRNPRTYFGYLTKLSK